MTVTGPDARWEPLRDQVRSETIKIRTARMLWLLPLCACVLAPLAALIVGMTGSMEPGDTVLGGALTGSALSLAVTAAWGALVMSSEFSSGTIRPVLAATPARGVVLTAKAIVAGSVAVVTGTVAISAAAVIGHVAIDAAKYPAGQLFPGVIGIVACFPLVAWLGLAVGALLRSSVGAVAVATAAVVLPQLSAAESFGALHRWSTLVAPTAVVTKLSQSSDAAPELMGSLGGWPRLALVAAGTLAAYLTARRRFDRIDV
ncbi:ABC transporter permease [Nocardia cyriacigeorgica]|uniref:ABC transporter permease n=1 Tax=Nocardia cyriacigeorgica TaxID=135487 RepID=UPI001894F99E|nr:ABC transporter permease [Nocardia cyriacigeorgica]MBF6416174.1 ABC transporter permease [Nocardia cyriacigeorgica]